jgi:Tol biopolymer transport system component
MNTWWPSIGILASIAFQTSIHPTYGQGPSILFQREEDPRIYSINPDGTNLIVVTEGSNPVWSPDGSLVLVRRQGNIWVTPTDGSESALLGAGTAYSWSPDGQQIAFSGARGIYLINKDGSGERELVPDGSLVGGPRWSPTNDSLIVYARRHPGSDEADDLFLLNVFSGESKLLSEFTYIHSIQYPFSPDGTRLLVLGSGIIDGNFSVEVLHLATGESVRIGPWGSGGAENPRWSPDGSRIAFDAREGIDGMHMASADGQAATELVPGRFEAAPIGAVWSPVGDMIAFTMRNWAKSQSQVYVINTDGSGLRYLADGTAVNWSPIRSGVPDTQEGSSIQPSTWGLLKALRRP